MSAGLRLPGHPGRGHTLSSKALPAALTADIQRLVYTLGGMRQRPENRSPLCGGSPLRPAFPRGRDRQVQASHRPASQLLITQQQLWKCPVFYCKNVDKAKGEKRNSYSDLVTLCYVRSSKIRDQTHVFCIGRQILYHCGDGQGGLVCCNSWGRKESDMTVLILIYGASLVAQW